MTGSSCRNRFMARYLRPSLALVLALVVTACPYLCLGGATSAPSAKAVSCCSHCRQKQAPADESVPRDVPKREAGTCLCCGALLSTGEQFDPVAPVRWSPIDAAIRLAEFSSRHASYYW